MNTKTRSMLRIISILIVALMVLMELNIVVIPALVAYKFWLMVISFCLLIISSK